MKPDGAMTLLLSQLSESVTILVAGVAPLLAAIRAGQNRHVTGFLWRSDLLITTDQGLPAASAYTVVLANGALISGRPGPRDPGQNLAAIWLDHQVSIKVPDAARSTAIGALVLALGADFDGSPTVRLTTIHGFPRMASGGTAGAAITLDLAGERVSPGGLVLDAEGRLLGMTSVSSKGDAMVLPHGAIARFADAATPMDHQAEPAVPGPMPMPVRPIQPVYTAAADPIGRDEARPLYTNGQDAGLTNGHQHNGRRGWLGVSLQPITIPDTLVQRAGQTTARQVVSVTKGGPAERAGLRGGDILLSVDRTPTTGNYALRSFLVPERVGSQVELRVMRDGLLHTAVMTIETQPEH